MGFKDISCQIKTWILHVCSQIKIRNNVMQVSERMNEKITCHKLESIWTLNEWLSPQKCISMDGYSLFLSQCLILRNSAHLESLHGGIVEHLARGLLHLLHRLQLRLGCLDLSLDHLGGCLSQLRHVLFILIFVFARCVSEEIPK